MIFNMIPILPGSAGSITALMPDLPINGWIILIVLAFVPTVFGFGLYNTSMNYIPASNANLLATLEPVLTALEAYIFLDEQMTTLQIIGGLLILSAMLMIFLEKE